MREPTNDEERLMIVGGFETLEEYLEWMNTPLTEEELHKCEEPDWEELALREEGCFESGCQDDNDPDVLANMQQLAEWWLEDDKKFKALREVRTAEEET